MSEEVRKFETGATRDTDNGKLDFEAFLSPAVLRRYAIYLHKHRLLPDGSLRSGDNWQKGIPREVYMKSMIRHVMEAWSLWRDNDYDGGFDHHGDSLREDILCAIMFNVMGNLFEILRERNG